MRKLNVGPEDWIDRGAYYDVCNSHSRSRCVGGQAPAGDQQRDNDSTLARWRSQDVPLPLPRPDMSLSV